MDSIKKNIMLLMMIVAATPQAYGGTAGENAGTSELTATITGGGTCTVKINGVDQGRALVTVGTGILETTDALRQSWPQLGKTNFTVDLTNCKGLSDMALSPAITVSGALMSAGNARLFRDAANSSSQGFGIALYSDQATNAGTPPQVQNAVPVSVATAGSVFNADQTLNWAAAVSCGDAVSCTPSASNVLNGGTLWASLTFTFSYQ